MLQLQIKRILSFHAFDKIQYKLIFLFQNYEKNSRLPFERRITILKKFNRHLPKKVDLSVSRL